MTAAQQDPASRDGPREDKTVCVFAARELARHRNGGLLRDIEHPDDLEHNLPAVDLIASDDVGVIVAEHTRALAYIEQMNDNRWADQLFEGFDDRFGHDLARPGRYTLFVDPTYLHKTRGEEANQLLSGLEDWVRSQHLPDPENLSCVVPPITAGPPGLPIRVSLYRRRCSPEDNGSLQWALVRARDDGARRNVTITQAFTRKCPKLKAAQEAARTASQNTTSLLVLESHDIQMVNPWEVFKATFAVAKDAEYIPDVIIWVDTAASNDEASWAAYMAKNGAWMDAATRP